MNVVSSPKKKGGTRERENEREIGTEARFFPHKNSRKWYFPCSFMAEFLEKSGKHILRRNLVLSKTNDGETDFQSFLKNKQGGLRVFFVDFCQGYCVH